MSLLGGFLGGGRKEGDVKESIEDILEEEDAEAELSPKERAMLRNLLKFGELKVADIMMPRADIVAVEVSSSFDQVMAVFAEAQHSRMPVFRETLDAPLGMIHLKDMIPAMASAEARASFDLMTLKRDVMFVTPSMPALDLLPKMQAARSHLAVVIDEYGGTDGIISIEDLVEQIVGEIDDEHDTDEEPHLELRQDGSFDADARATIEDLEKAAGIELMIGGERPEMETIGGLVAALAGRVPQTGEIVRHDQSGLEFEVSDADPRRLKRVRIRRFADPELAEGAPGAGPG
ncbi:MAG: HlyC/CorC family transporter [Alphaproteobacteria bacterium]|nr:HlyC/CorC family transporter [Alphaproteobacteria bacterium]